MIPNTLEEAYAELDRMMGIDFRNIGFDKVGDYHHTLGRWIRNNWGLWRDLAVQEKYHVPASPLRELLVKMGFSHADDMSAVILESYWYRLRDIFYDFNEKAKFYKDYWDKTLK